MWAMTKQIARSTEARKVLRELNAELQASADRLGQSLVWSAVRVNSGRLAHRGTDETVAERAP